MRTRRSKKKWISASEPEFDFSNTTKASLKVRITTYIDLDILDELKKRAKTLGIPYQTLLNSELRQAIAPGSSRATFPTSDEIRQILREELHRV